MVQDRGESFFLIVLFLKNYKRLPVEFRHWHVCCLDVGITMICDAVRLDHYHRLSLSIHLVVAWPRRGTLDNNRDEPICS